MNLEELATACETSGREDSVNCSGDGIIEPDVGMEFESEDAAKFFYDGYARRVGFVMRVMSCWRSEVDGRILARRLGCNKEGFYSMRGKNGQVKKPKTSTREGCKAMIHVKTNKSGKWVITKFVKEHNHPLVAPREGRQTMFRKVASTIVRDDKDKQILELTTQLRNKTRECASYQEQLAEILKIIEEHNDQLSRKVLHVVNNLKEYETKDKEAVKER